MIVPKRIQRRRTKGWRMPPGAVYVGRPLKWGNPVVIGSQYGIPGHKRYLRKYVTVTPALAAAIYRVWIKDKLLDDPGFLAPLRGKDLACWCKLDDPCHADILLELANL